MSEFLAKAEREGNFGDEKNKAAILKYAEEALGMPLPAYISESGEYRYRLRVRFEGELFVARLENFLSPAASVVRKVSAKRATELPRVLAEMKDIYSKLRENADEISKANEETRLRLEALFGPLVIPSEWGQFTHYGVKGRLKLTDFGVELKAHGDGTVDLEIKGLGEEQAAAVLRAIQGQKIG